MNAKQFIAAAAVFLAAAGIATTAAAADAPVSNGAVAQVAAGAASLVMASNLNLPTVSINKSGSRSRAEVHAEAVAFVKNYKSAFAVQLEQYKN